MIRRLALGLAVLLTGPTAPAADDRSDSTPRFAVVDMERLFAAHPATEDATEKLSEARETIREEFKEKSNALKEILQRHQELIRADEKDEAVEQLKKANEAEKAIATLRTTRQRDVEHRFRRAKRKIMRDIRTAVAEFNADGRYALVFDRSAASSNDLPQVVHAPGAEDITDEVIAFLDEKAAEPKGEERGDEP